LRVASARRVFNGVVERAVSVVEDLVHLDIAGSDGVKIVDAEDQVARRVSLSQCLAGDDRGFPSWTASSARRGSVSRGLGIERPA
jgi:hypothetical protein